LVNETVNGKTFPTLGISSVFTYLSRMMAATTSFLEADSIASMLPKLECFIMQLWRETNSRRIQQEWQQVRVGVELGSIIGIIIIIIFQSQNDPQYQLSVTLSLKYLNATLFHQKIIGFHR
jgi:putative effector of murein hydrolase